MSDARGFEIEPIGGRLASGSDQQMGAVDGLFAARRFDRHFTLPLACVTATTFTPLRMTTPSRSSRSSTIAAHSGSSLASGCRRFQHGHLAADAAKGLRHFQADRAGANDNEMRGSFGEIENRFRW